MSPRFGTDGIRGVANRDLTPALVLALGEAAAQVLGRGPFLIGRDTRRSGSALASALAAGLAAEGAEVWELGVAPTPAVAYLCARHALPGAVISASHNPAQDNGVKLIGAGGAKVEPDAERAIEAALDANLRRGLAPSPAPAVPPPACETEPGARGADGDAPRWSTRHPSRTPPELGEVRARHELLGDYEEHLVGALEGRRLDGMSVVVDPANGAGFALAPRVLARLGASVRVVAGEPDGANINLRCGSTDTALLARTVREERADVGLALDGDADRLVAVDHEGRVVDGDRLLVLFALDLAARGLLGVPVVATTVMANLGVSRALDAAGIAVVETPVGDRHLGEAMAAKDLLLGGEQSGHLIFRSLSTTGDGLLTGILLLDLLERRGSSLASLARTCMVPLPQRLRSVPVAHPDVAARDPGLLEEVARAEAELAGRGRVLVRPSGTEPVVRIMVEAEAEADADQVLERLVRRVEGGVGRV